MIYTAIFGGKDSLIEQKGICFTDRDIKSELWDVVRCKPFFNDPRKSAKVYKVISHACIKSEWSIWIDGNIELKVDPEYLIEKTQPKEIGLFQHPQRSTIYEEAEACKRLGKDNPELIDKTVNRYKNVNGLWCGFIIVRKHTKQMAILNEQWWYEINTGSIRDQLSLPYIFRDVQNLGKVNINNNRYFRRHKHLK